MPSVSKIRASSERTGQALRYVGDHSLWLVAMAMRSEPGTSQQRAAASTYYEPCDVRWHWQQIFLSLFGCSGYGLWLWRLAVPSASRQMNSSSDVILVLASDVLRLRCERLQQCMPERPQSASSGQRPA